MAEESAVRPHLTPFHLAFPVRDVQEAREFYTKCVQRQQLLQEQRF
jgi:extradiol dioxygenase family protein